MQKRTSAEDAYSEFDGFDIYRPNSPFQGRNGTCEERINGTDVDRLNRDALFARGLYE
jgi:hypothetical protein